MIEKVDWKSDVVNYESKRSLYGYLRIREWN